MIQRRLAGLSLVTVFVAFTPAAERAATVSRLQRDVTFLASDECEGRGPGTAGIDKAAVYVAGAFKQAGLKGGMGNGSFFQPFVIKGNPELGRDNSVVWTDSRGPTALKFVAEYQPLGLSGTGVGEGPVVFVGYAAAVSNYDDFHGIDVAGKVVLMIRRLPRYGRADQPFADDQTIQEAAALATKLGNAEKNKAAAILLCNDASELDDALIDFGYSAFGQASGVPAVHIRRSTADQLLRAGLGQSLADIEKAIDADLKARSAPLKGVTAKVQVTVERKPIDVKNVIGVLDGAGRLANETIVLGAHYDHLGYGGPNSTQPGVKAIHHGADDNASGTATLMELARRLAVDPPANRRRLVFIAFSAEEVGLLGSAHYAKEPLFPLDSTTAMINLDMVGRLVDDATTGKPKLEIGGTGTAKEFDGLLDRLNAIHGFALKKNSAGIGPSDHTSFYVKGVPVFFFFSGLHRQYHKPSDTVDLINFAGMAKITDMVEELARLLATDKTRPEYVKGMGGSMPGGGRMSVPRLGFMPGDYGEDAEGVLIASVNKDGPAEKAGIKDGDVIIAIAGQPVKNMGAYMKTMGAQKRGQPVELTIQRKGQQIKVTVTPQ